MKKLIFILVAFITFNSVNAQDGPSKKETFEFIEMMINNSPKSQYTESSPLTTKLSVIDSNYDDLSLTVDNFMEGFKDGSKQSRVSTFHLKDLKNDIISIHDNEIKYYLERYQIRLDFKRNFEIKVYKSGKYFQTLDPIINWIEIPFSTKKDAERFIKALKHLQNMLKGNVSKSLFDD